MEESSNIRAGSGNRRLKGVGGKRRGYRSLNFKPTVDCGSLRTRPEIAMRVTRRKFEGRSTGAVDNEFEGQLMAPRARTAT
jgi:hypothetical protein